MVSLHIKERVLAVAAVWLKIMRILFFAVLVVVSVTYAQIPDHCLMDVDPGCCVGEITRWFYNRDSQCCEKFAYTGCRGNHNNFGTYSDCLNECVYAVPDKEGEEDSSEEETLEEDDDEEED